MFSLYCSDKCKIRATAQMVMVKTSLILLLYKFVFCLSFYFASLGVCLVIFIPMSMRNCVISWIAMIRVVNPFNLSTIIIIFNM